MIHALMGPDLDHAFVAEVFVDRREFGAAELFGVGQEILHFFQIVHGLDQTDRFILLIL